METTQNRDTVQDKMDRRLRTCYFRGNGEMLLLSPAEAELFRLEGIGQYINGVHEERETGRQDNNGVKNG